MTRLLPDAPSAYARSQLGPKSIAWMTSKGWIDQRRVVRHTQVAAAYRICQLIDGARPMIDRSV